MIFVDTREKKNAHILRYFENHNIAYVQKKLDVCDYSADDLVLVERKQNLQELAGNILKENGRRIKAEFDRVPKECKVYVLIEEDIRELKNVTSWHSPHTKLTGTTLYRYMVSYQKRHNLQYIFCDKRDSGRIIANLLVRGDKCGTGMD